MLDARPRLLGLGTANPPEKYQQEELLTRFRVDDPRIKSLFTSSHIRTRHLYLPSPGPNGEPFETQGQLLQKHRKGAMEIGGAAIRSCLEKNSLEAKNIDFLCCLTSTGWLTPGLTAILIRQLGFRQDCARVDIVGMGCNAGLNGLNVVTSWASANPGKNALLACVEVCSAAYVFDGSMRTAIVNSLFGDGAAALLVRAAPQDDPLFAPQILGFESHIIPEAIEAMRFDWDDQHGKYSFFLDRDIPYVVGANARVPVERLLSRFNLKKRHIDHWIVHSGGKKVVDAIKYNLGITDWDVRHTHSILRDYGNLSSGSFLFSFQRLLEEGRVKRGDYGVMMTMGPGSQIETALIRW
jgi:predicted naringenin-chalcone synthase